MNTPEKETSVATEDNNPEVQSADVSRSCFLRGSVGLFALAWSIMAAYPLYLYLKPSGKDESAESHVSSVDLGQKDSIVPGGGKNFRFGSTPAIITRSVDGDFHAFNAICTHLGCTVQYRMEKKEIWCACHGGCYDASTGKNISGPPPKPLKPLKVDLVNGKIIVSKA